jgi:hypothetical protein
MGSCRIGRSTASHYSALIIPPGGDGRKAEGHVGSWWTVALRRLPSALLGGEERPPGPRPSTWRFSLEEAGTEERRAFRDLASLVAYLERELGRGDAGADSAQEDEKEEVS